MIISILCLIKWCPRSKVFGGATRSTGGAHYHKGKIRSTSADDGYFRTPFVPFLPCIGIVVNWYLISQLELVGIGFLITFLGLTTLYYFAYAGQHSIVGNSGDDNFNRTVSNAADGFDSIKGHTNIQNQVSDGDDGDFHKLKRMISLPVIH